MDGKIELTDSFKSFIKVFNKLYWSLDLNESEILPKPKQTIQIGIGHINLTSFITTASSSIDVDCSTSFVEILNASFSSSKKKTIFKKKKLVYFFLL